MYAGTRGAAKPNRHKASGQGVELLTEFYGMPVIDHDRQQLCAALASVKEGK